MVRDVSIDFQPDNAAWYYHHPHYGYNCAQAIVKHFGDSYADISKMSQMGSGRAPEGHCGVLHGALYLLGNEQGACKEMTKKFAQQADSPLCRKIRKINTPTCQQCVKIADKLLT
jgi:hypothetical protein